MKTNGLKWLRVVLALLIFIPTVLFFIDVFHLLPIKWDVILHVQLVPAILDSMWGIVIVILLLTLLFGRIYCSVICPAGILQDFFSRFSAGKKKRRQRRVLKYAKPKNWLRYTILALTVGSFMLGSSALIVLLDPYSNMGRVLADLVRPALIPLNAFVVNKAFAMGIYSFLPVSASGISMVAIVVSSLFLITIAVMSLLRGRLYCNTICPVGTFLGLVSRFSLFRVVINESACTHCNVCSRSCKSQCIDSKESIIDTSRCVTCFNCLTSCTQNAIGYRFAGFSKSHKAVPTVEKTVNTRRREFLALSTTAMMTAPFAMAQSQSKKLATQQLPIMPPGAGKREHFNMRCTACHACVTQCPSNVLIPAVFDYGIMGLMQPRMYYDKGFCQPNCTICMDVCPAGALTPLTLKEKQLTQVGRVAFTLEDCVVYKNHTDCGSCSEHCPTQAVKMVDYKDGLRIPEVTPEICIGCGGCEYACPARPKAIVVHANYDQQWAKKPPKEKEKNIEVQSFGF
ncbi:4Fe-4S binding protein [Microbacter margulisiae]|uniref:Ferredoxin n=1 Tax=Microbacter margulisiae TaxID=1350067 RepID=A0A7W5DQ86_9PORP|nr:4Fe-4S dicluster domain-containing protein [Microbacter margulisiae]MBB3186758.1 ferredoxin [Microbacter margulisiae]